MASMLKKSAGRSNRVSSRLFPGCNLEAGGADQSAA
jgi:hypothetical protein